MKIVLNLLFFFSFLFFINIATASEKPLVFSMVAKIKPSDLDYRITNVQLIPNRLELEFDEKNNKFNSEQVELDIETNMIADSSNTFDFALSIQNHKSSCTYWDGTEYTYSNPTILINIKGSDVKLTDTLSSGINFNSTYKEGGVDYISDKRSITLDFSELPSDIDKTSIERCDGSFTLVAGLEL